MVGHVVLAIHIVHSLETNRAGPISSQILVLSEHNLFTLKEKRNYIPILYFNSLDYAYFVSLPFLTVPCQVGLQSVIVAFLLAIHIVHSLKTNRAWPISSQILVLYEHN